MDLKDKIKKNNGNTAAQAPFRQSGADRSAYTSSSYRSRNPNRQAPRSVQYQPEPETDFESTNMQETYENIPTQPLYGQDFVPQSQPQNQQVFAQNHFPNETAMQYPVQQGQEFFPQQNSVPHVAEGEFVSHTAEQDDANMLDLNAFFGSKQDEIEPQQNLTGVMPNAVPRDMQNNNAEQFTLQDAPAKNEETKTQDISKKNNEKNKIKIKNNFIGLISNIFSRYEIDKVLIVDGKIYTVNFTGEEDSEIFEENIDVDVITEFAYHCADIGHAELTVEDGIRIEMTCPPVSPEITIVASKMEFDLYIDEDFVRILFEFLIKRKNVAILSSCALDTLYKVVADYYDNALCVTINEPIKTNNNITFYENPAYPSLKTVYSITNKISPDNVLVYTPSDILFTITHMKRHNGVVLFSETDNAADFVNADIIHALGGVSEYNRVSILKAIDIIFTVTKTKDGKTKYTATQLLSPTNKSHVNKIKRIVGDGEIDMGKIYFHNVFDKEV